MVSQSSQFHQRAGHAVCKELLQSRIAETTLGSSEKKGKNKVAHAGFFTGQYMDEY